jgi:hypothetical protein
MIDEGKQTDKKKNLLKFLTLLFILLVPSSYIAYADLTDDAFKAIEEGYLAILNAEKVGGNVKVGIIMLNQASDLIAKGGEDNLRNAITLANGAKSLALSIEQNNRTEQIYAYSRLLVFLIISLVAILLIKKYGNRVYYSLWASTRGDWRIE